jgi:chemotaxis protein CheD
MPCVVGLRAAEAGSTGNMQSFSDRPDVSARPAVDAMAAADGFAVGQRIVVGLGELAVSQSPSAVLTAYMLGSCMAVAAYDPKLKLGGLIHAMLPDSSVDPTRAREHPAMFLDIGLPALMQQMSQLGADSTRLRIVAAGAARLIDDQHVFDIGDRNCVALDAFLSSQGLATAARHIGGHANRTLHLHLATGLVSVKVSGLPGEIQLC